jgi:hypothetical protein
MMYQLIEKYAAVIVSKIDRGCVNDYKWLLDNPNQVLRSYYQGKYRNFWGMNQSRLGDKFFIPYFATLNSTLNNATTLTNVVNTLYGSATQENGKPYFAFSFATKLLHMTNTKLPVYDSRVVGFYFFREPTMKKGGGLQGYIADFVKLHDFLIEEYDRILKQGLLSKAIDEFETRFQSHGFSREKIIDSLIWAFAGNGLLQTKEVIYE